jgi:hypothetical protein
MCPPAYVIMCITYECAYAEYAYASPPPLYVEVRLHTHIYMHNYHATPSHAA